MKSLKNDKRILDIIEYIFENQKSGLGFFGEYGQIIEISVVYSDFRKRYTEFYRLRIVIESREPIFCWVRVVKNKSQEFITEVLRRQFEVMTEIYSGFTDTPDGSLILNCCCPVALLADYNAVITKECTGTLLNKYLQTRFPLFSKDRTIKHFMNCGLWLRKYHEFYKYDNKSVEEYDTYLSQFLLKYNREPLDSLNYITLCHNDYSPRNIFVADNSVEVIDFVGSHTGFPEQDILFFKNYVYKAKFNMFYSRKFKAEMVKAFDFGYGS